MIVKLHPCGNERPRTTFFGSLIDVDEDDDVDDDKGTEITVAMVTTIWCRSGNGEQVTPKGLTKLAPKLYSRATDLELGEPLSHGGQKGSKFWGAKSGEANPEGQIRATDLELGNAVTHLNSIEDPSNASVVYKKCNTCAVRCARSSFCTLAHMLTSSLSNLFPASKKHFAFSLPLMKTELQRFEGMRQVATLFAVWSVSCCILTLSVC